MAVMIMTLSKLWKKLRQQNRQQYRQFRFCIGFAVMLITSYIMMLMSPLIQETLPQGGDSRKQVMMIFAVAAAGCIVFVLYAAGLFLRYKSREIGVFLALGTEKSKVGKALLGEIMATAAVTSAVGAAAGCLLSLGIGKLFERLVQEVSEQSYAFTWQGLAGSLLFAAVILCMLLAVTMRFMKRSNIMDILNEQRKQEPLKRMVTSAYLVRGIILTVAGILLGFVMPTLVTSLTKHYLGAWTNLFYLAALLGIYQILVYSIACHKKGKRPQKYYNNVISYGMLKFQGRSIVRNMLVITLLLLGGLFSAFYAPQNLMAMQSSLQQHESMYSFFYTEGAGVPEKEEIQRMAQKHGVELEHYRMAEWIQAAGSGVNRDNADENGDLQEIYEEKHAVYEMMSAKNFRRMTGQRVQIPQGAYYMIQTSDAQENLFFSFDDMDRIYLDKQKRFMEMEYKGNLVYRSLVQGRGFDAEARFVVNDRDYEKIKKGTGLFPREVQVLFDSSKGGGAAAFSAELYRQFGERISDDMKVCGAYDAYQAQVQGSDYGYAGMVQYDPENPVKEADWQYEPVFTILEESGGAASFAVQLLLFLYVSVICLAAAGVVSFARSQSTALSNQPVFDDLQKLGADRRYRRRLLQKQIRKIYVMPAWISSVGILCFEALVLTFNDGKFMPGEWKILLVFVLMTLIAAAYQYGTYRFSFGKVKKMLSLDQ